MNRIVIPVQVGEARHKYSLRIDDEPSSSDDPQRKRYRQIEFLRTIAETPSLLTCGSAFPDRFSVFHNGTNWVLEAEAEADDPASRV